jgi:hypothetical protein
MLLICDKAGRIIYVGQLFCSSQVDFTLFKKELARFAYDNKQVWVDLGFTGIKNLLPQEQVQIGYKKPRNKELTKQQKLHNQEISTTRVVVEHAIGGMKRYFILRHENRIRLRNKISDAVEICASLWNFKRGFSLKTA